ncbi:hypothetical protein SOPP22_04000 [Shewanella sp. OPT22]|nr:hypothetical protein SOPP22_04000 [Shewanella sp. OPT22]
MKKSTQTALTGTALALAMAGLTSCSTMNNSPNSSGGDTSSAVEMVHCYGVNQCNGHNDCKTDGNSCKGQAGCNGTGFVAMPAKACKDVGGQIKDAWRGKRDKAALSKCYGVNKCNGHNDCAGKEHSCKGEASCKGTGFVLMPAKACKDIGGKS